eukprot:4072869-Prorocentrum_lima.AAC.1
MDFEGVNVKLVGDNRGLPLAIPLRDSEHTRAEHCHVSDMHSPVQLASGPCEQVEPSNRHCCCFAVDVCQEAQTMQEVGQHVRPCLEHGQRHDPRDVEVQSAGDDL